MKKKEIEPISHKTFKHLNTKVRLLGYPPLIGASLLISALFLPILSYSFKSIPLMFFSGIFLLIFIPFTIKQMKNVKKRKMDLIDLFIASPKLRKNYQDDGTILNLIKKV